MSNNEHRPLPPELQTRLEQETPEGRAELERVWDLLDAGRPPVKELPDARETWAVLHQRLDFDADVPPAPKRSRRAADRLAARRNRTPRTWPRRIATAAAIMVAVIAGLLLWRQPVRTSVPPGTSRAVSLPDGSSAALNSGTTLSYRRGFTALPFFPAARRTVTLQGEAFFEVAEGERPFVVETFNARVEVAGTQFNVQAWPNVPASATQVTLTAGRVQVTAQTSPQHPVTLTQAGQSSSVVGSASPPTAPQQTSIDRVLAWRKQGFAVSDQPLAAILDQLERRYGTRLTLHDRSAASDSMTLFYPQRTDLETILHDICVAKRLAYRPTSQGYAIFPKRPTDQGDQRSE